MRQGPDLVGEVDIRRKRSEGGGPSEGKNLPTYGSWGGTGGFY